MIKSSILALISSSFAKTDGGLIGSAMNLNTSGLEAAATEL